MLVSTPVITALKEAWPNCHLTYLVPKGTEDMVAGHPGLDDLMVVDRRGETWSRALRLVNLRRRRFDLVIELSGGDRGAIYSWLTGAKERLGFARPGMSFWQRRRFYPPAAPATGQDAPGGPKSGSRAGPGYRAPNPRLRFFWDQAVEERIQDLLTAHKLPPGGFVVMHPGAGWRFKCWTPQGYARVLEALQNEWRLPVILTGTKAAHEQELISRNFAGKPRQSPINLAGRLSLKELGALIAQARFFFGMDSAPMHLAAAVETPAVALFGPSGVFNWGPWGEGHLVIQQDWACVPCGRDGCEGSKISRCLTGDRTGGGFASHGGISANDFLRLCVFA